MANYDDLAVLGVTWRSGVEAYRQIIPGLLRDLAGKGLGPPFLWLGGFQRRVKRLYTKLKAVYSQNPDFPIGFIGVEASSDGRPHPLSISFSMTFSMRWERCV